MQTIRQQIAKAKQLHNSHALMGLTNFGILKIRKSVSAICQRFAGSKYTETMTEEEQQRLATAMEQEKDTYQRRPIRVIANKEVDDNFKYNAIKELRDELMPLSPEIVELIRFDPEEEAFKNKKAEEKLKDPSQVIEYNEMRDNATPQTMNTSSLVLPYQRSDVFNKLRLEDERHHQFKEAAYPSKTKVQYIRKPSPPAPDKYTYSSKKFQGLTEAYSRDRYV